MWGDVGRLGTLSGESVLFLVLLYLSSKYICTVGISVFTKNSSHEDYNRYDCNIHFCQTLGIKKNHRHFLESNMVVHITFHPSIEPYQWKISSSTVSEIRIYIPI